MKQELKIIKERALVAFKDGGQKEKDLLKNLFGEEVFTFDPINDINSFEDVLIINGVDPDSFDWSCIGLSSDEIAYRKIKLIVKAYNGEWTPDWSNSSQCKYYPWFVWKGSASSFSYCVYVYAYSLSSLGSRLVYQNKDHAIDAGKKFESIYNEFLKP